MLGDIYIQVINGQGKQIVKSSEGANLFVSDIVRIEHRITWVELCDDRARTLSSFLENGTDDV